MRIYKPTYSKPLPEGAKVFSRKHIKYARYKDKRGRTQEARLTKSGDKILCEVSHWHIQFEDNLSIRRELKAYTFEQETKTLADRIQALLNYKSNNQPLDSELQKFIENLNAKIRNELIGFGLLDSQKASAGKKLRELVSEYVQFLEAKERSDKYISDTQAELERIFEGCSVQFWSDIAPTQVMAYLKKLRDEGLSYRRSNAYLKSTKAFCKWMVECSYVSHSPLNHLKTLNVELDRRRQRRALTTDELRRLLEATISSEELFGMTGAERCLLYYTATQLGLRANEIRTLKVESFDLDDLTVTVEAGNSKRRTEDILPIRQHLGVRLKEFFKSKLPTTKAFGGTYQYLTDKTALMLKADLAKAKIDYVDSAGKVCDFHSLRGTFITALDKTDASLKERMTLARHSDKGNLTLGTYTDRPKVFDLRRVVEQLPDVWPKQAQAMKATGTDGKPVDAEGNFLSKSCFPQTKHNSNMETSGKLIPKNIQKTLLKENNKGMLKTHNPLVVGSNPTGPIQKRGFLKEG
ncbi:MAG: site-specific integrase [Planctomycetes bacterium]|nr:site-specific integrase [Planctomycetota bacterium]